VAAVSSKAYMRKDLPPRSLDCRHHSVACRLPNWGPQFLAGSQSELPSVPCHVALSIGQITIWNLTSSKPTRERVSQEDRLYSLI